MLYKKFSSCVFSVCFLVFPWLSPVILRNFQTLGKCYTFLIILRSRQGISPINSYLIDATFLPCTAEISNWKLDAEDWFEHKTMYCFDPRWQDMRRAARMHFPMPGMESWWSRQHFQPTGYHHESSARIHAWAWNTDYMQVQWCWSGMDMIDSMGKNVQSMLNS